MPERTINVTIALPLADDLQDTIRKTHPRLKVTALTRAQRRVYRDGRPLWAGYPEPPRAEDESEEEARERLQPILRDTEVLLTNPIVPDNIVGRAPALKWLQLTSAGVDRLLDAPVVQSQVTVTTASGIHAVPISEYVIGAMLAFAKGLPRAIRAQQERVWRPYWPDELEEKTVGVLGVGAIGARVVELASALGMRVLALRRSAERRITGAAAGFPAADEMLPPSDLTYLLHESDYVVVALPLTPESRGLIGEAQLRAMKPSAASSDGTTAMLRIRSRYSVSQSASVAAVTSGASARTRSSTNRRSSRHSRTGLSRALPSTSSSRNPSQARASCGVWRT